MLPNVSISRVKYLLAQCSGGGVTRATSRKNNARVCLNKMPLTIGLSTNAVDLGLIDLEAVSDGDSLPGLP